MAINFYYTMEIYFTPVELFVFFLLFLFFLPWGKFIQINQNGDTKGVEYMQGV